MDWEQVPDARAAVITQLMDVAASAGATNAYRALTYLVVRYPPLFIRAAERYEQNFRLATIASRPVSASRRNLVDVIFSFTHRTTGATEKEYLRVDVTEQYPFVVTALSPYIER